MITPEEIEAIADTVGNARDAVEFAPVEWAVKPCGEDGCVQLLAWGHLTTGLPQMDGTQGAALHLDRATVTALASALAPVVEAEPDPAPGKAALLAELFDMAEDGDIPGTVIRHDGHEVWIHTTGQVTGWLHTLQEKAEETGR